MDRNVRRERLITGAMCQRHLLLPAAIRTLGNEFKSQHDAELFKQTIITVPLNGVSVADPSDGMDFSARFLRVAKDSHQAPFTVLIRAEYESVAEVMDNLFYAPEVKGCVLLGHPGIEFQGKSVFMNYILIRRLLNGHNTYVRKRTGDFRNYLVETGLDNNLAMLLYDSNERLDPPEHKAGEFWPVLITFPATHRYKEWKNQVGPSMIWMKPWDWEEVYAIGMGPSIRPASRALSGDLAAVEIDFTTAVDLALSKMMENGSRLLRRALEAIHTGTGSTENTNPLPSAVFMLKPADETWRGYIIDTITRPMAYKFLLALEQAAANEQAMFANLFSSTSAAASARGNLFEARFLQLLRKKILNTHVDYHARFLPRKSVDPGTGTNNITFTIPHRTTVFDVDNVSGFKLPPSPLVLIPAKSNQPTWDFLTCLNDSMVTDIPDRTATRAVTATAVEKRPVEWSNFFLTGRHGQRHGRDGR
ncbi:hypothetical protein C8R44DRAFT_952708 [Mycena epipterygia]|nr:hypothetical protein C8R44DRAFT_952708 [Mycena epipterygia]